MESVPILCNTVKFIEINRNISKHHNSLLVRISILSLFDASNKFYAASITLWRVIWNQFKDERRNMDTLFSQWCHGVGFQILKMLGKATERSTIEFTTSRNWAFAFNGSKLSVLRR